MIAYRILFTSSNKNISELERNTPLSVRVLATKKYYYEIKHLTKQKRTKKHNKVKSNPYLIIMWYEKLYIWFS